MMEGPAALLIAALGLEVVPPFDKPWLSESLADFWTRCELLLQPAVQCGAVAHSTVLPAVLEVPGCAWSRSHSTWLHDVYNRGDQLAPTPFTLSLSTYPTHFCCASKGVSLVRPP
jgi:hypothetical protein